MDSIPFGQPMMPDHHSYSRDLSFRDRTQRMYGKAIAEGQRAAYLASRSEAAENTQRHRNNPAVTLRRIASWRPTCAGCTGGRQASPPMDSPWS